MEKRGSKRKQNVNWQDLFANIIVCSNKIKIPVLDISIGGMGVLITDGFSLFKEGKEILIETLEKDGEIIAASISGKIAYLGPGVPCRAGIEFSPSDTPIEAYTKLSKNKKKNPGIINDKNQILGLFTEIKKWSRGFGDMLMIDKNKAIPAELFYLRPENDNMVLRIVRISELRLPFEPEVGKSYTFFLFKGINVMTFTATVNNIIKNILETSWPTELHYISRRSMLRYFVTGQEPVTANIIHPISGKDIPTILWDISIEGMGAELLDDDMPFIEGMNLPSIRLDLPKGQVEVKGIIRSVRTENMLQKTQIGVEFIEGQDGYQDRILNFILDMNLPSENVLNM